MRFDVVVAVATTQLAGDDAVGEQRVEHQDRGAVGAPDADAVASEPGLRREQPTLASAALAGVAAAGLGLARIGHRDDRRRLTARSTVRTHTPSSSAIWR